MKRAAIDLPLVLLGAALLAIFIGQALWPDASLYRDVITATVRLYVGGVCKLSALVLGAYYGWRVAARFSPKNPSRRPWQALAVWLSTWSAGQACLGWYQWILAESTPFPSVADPFWVFGYLSMVVGFALLLRAYVSSGLAFGSGRGYAVLGGLVASAALLVGYVVLAPIVSAGGTPLELALNLAYPLLDLVALVPAALLMRITFQLRGGSVFRVWALLLGGFVAMAVGDVLYAYLTMLDVHAVDAVIDVSFIAGYGLAARGIYEQHRVSA
jgi:hypothetical protein